MRQQPILFSVVLASAMALPAFGQTPTPPQGAPSSERLMRDLEEEFGIEIPDEDQEKVMTVGQATDYIVNKVKEKEGKEKEG